MGAADPSISKTRASDGVRDCGDVHGRDHERGRVNDHDGRANGYGHARGRGRGCGRHHANENVYEQGRPRRCFAPGSPALQRSDAREMVGSPAVVGGRGSWGGSATCFGGPESEGLRRYFHGYGCDYDRDYGRGRGRGCGYGYGTARNHWTSSSVTSSGRKRVANGYD